MQQGKQMEIHRINIKQKLSLLTEQWSPKIIAQMNDYVFKLAKIQGDFIWHSHPETDEAFIVLEGSLVIEYRDDRIELEKGEMCVVPKGVEHKPFAERECHIMLIEPASTVNTGDEGGERMIEAEWI
jgi:mannose-6-phosphate isomerase-like protein (cupin superfamily)